MHKAAANGDLHKLTKLVEKSKDDVNLTNNNKETPLHRASAAGHKRCVECLIQNGANIDAPDKWGQTPLMCAIYNQRMQIGSLLLQKGADPNSANESGDTALHWASYWASHRGYLEMIAALLQYKADINAINKSGNTPLHEAGRQGQAKAVEILLQNGADITIRNNYNKSGADILYDNKSWIYILPELDHKDVFDHWSRIDVPSLYLPFKKEADKMGFYWKLIHYCVNFGWEICGKRHINMTTFVLNKIKRVHAVITCLPHPTNSLKIELFYVKDSEPPNPLQYLPHVLSSIVYVLELQTNQNITTPHLNPCWPKEEDTRCFIDIANIDINEHEAAVCPVHYKPIYVQRMRPWFWGSQTAMPNKGANVLSDITTDDYLGTCTTFQQNVVESNAKEAEKYLRELSKLVTNEDILYDIGIDLDFSGDEIESIRIDNPTSIRNAGYKLLRLWRNRQDATENSDLKLKLASAFNSAKLAGKFDNIR